MWRRRMTRRHDPPNNGFLSCLYDNFKGDILDISGLLLDRLAIGSKGSFKLSNPELAHEGISGKRRRSTRLPCFTRQEL